MNRRPHLVSTLFLLTVATACGQKSLEGSSYQTASPTDPRKPSAAAKPSQSPAPGSQDQKPATAIVRLLDVAPVPKKLYMPAPTLLGPAALEEVFRPIFGSSPRSRPGASPFFTANPNAYFTPDERMKLGEIHVSGPSSGTLVEQGTRLTAPQALEASYLKSLRSFASDACRGLVAVEMSAAPDSGVLVHSPPAKAEKVSGFLSRLLRRPPGSEPLKGAADYAAATNVALQEAGRETNNSRRQTLVTGAWTELCVALVTDPRIFIR